MDIRELATSWNGSLIAAGEFERTVHIFDVETGKHGVTFDTTFDAGGTRVAITEDGLHCVAAAYHIHGVAAYSTQDGTEVWRRKDLKGIQAVRVSRDDRNVYCCDEKPCQILNRNTGKTVDSLRGVHDIWESPYASIRLLGKQSLELTEISGERLPKISRTTFAVLCAAFGPKFVCISESTGPVRCFAVSTGDLAWKHDPPRGVHFLDLAFAETLETFVGVSWPYERRGPTVLYRFDSRTGDPRVIVELGKPVETAFCKKGTLLVTSHGEVFNVANGKKVRSLAFPP